MKQLIFKIILFSCLFSITLFGILDPSIYGETRFSNVFKELNDLEDKNVDILYCGNSKIFTSLNPAIIDSTLGSVSYNLGSGAQNLESTSFLIHEILKEYNTKMIILDVSPGDVYHLYAPAIKPYQLAVYDNLPLSFEKLKILNKNYSLKDLPKTISPTIRNHDNWDNVFFNTKSQIFSLSSGYIRGYQNTPHANLTEEQKNEYANFNTYKYSYDNNNIVIDAKVKESLLSIYNTAKINDVELMLVTIPYLGWYNDKNADFYKYTSAINHIADSLNINYLNLNKEYEKLNIDINDFKDIAHLNSSGASKVSKYVANYIKSEEPDFVNAINLSKKKKGLIYLNGNIKSKLRYRTTTNYIFDSIKVEEVYILDTKKNSRNFAIEFTSEKEIDPNKMIIQVHGRPDKKNQKHLNFKTKEEENDRDIFYTKPYLYTVGNKKYLIAETPYSNIDKYISILLFFQDAKTLEVTRPPLIINEINIYP